MIQVAPDVSRHRMNKMAQASPRTRPAPLRVAAPLAVTWPPYTVKTVWMALTNPLKLVMALARQDDQDADHGQGVEHHAGLYAGAGDGERHVALRVG